jgi:hypothetical protein
MQISLSSRDEILESKFIKNYIKEIALLRGELNSKDAEIESMRLMVETWANRERQPLDSQLASMEDYAEEELDKVVSIDDNGVPAVMTEHLEFPNEQFNYDDEEISKYMNQGEKDNISRSEIRT